MLERTAARLTKPPERADPAGIATAGLKGIPTLGLGPGNEVYAHAADEACPVEHLSAAVAFYAALVARLNAKA